MLGLEIKIFRNVIDNKFASFNVIYSSFKESINVIKEVLYTTIFLMKCIISG